MKSTKIQKMLSEQEEVWFTGMLGSVEVCMARMVAVMSLEQA